MGKSTLDISGVFPAIPTPFNKDGSIAYDKLEHNVKKWNEIPFAGYVVVGSTGESVLLSSDERVELVKKVKQFAAKGKLILGGSGYEGTALTIDVSKRMAKAGADAVMIVAPSYYRGSMSSAALKSHYTEVANSSPVPVILYSNPKCALDIPAEVAIELADHPNIIGMKESGGDIIKVGRILAGTQDKDFQVLTGRSVSFLLPSLVVGAVGTITGLGIFMGKEVCELYNLVKKGKLEEARELHNKLMDPAAELLGINNKQKCEVSGIQVALCHGTPGIKAAMDWKGYYGGPLRLPLLSLNEDDKENMKKIFVKAGYVTE